MSQNIKELSIKDISLKEASVEKPIEKQKEKPKGILEKEVIEIKSGEEKIAKLLEEKPVSIEVSSIPKKKEEVKPRPRCKPKPKPVIMEPPKKWEDRWIKVDGKMVLFVPSGFEIMTKNGWRPIITRADKIQK